MPDVCRIVVPGNKERTVITGNGNELTPPDNWILLPPDDAALIRQVKHAGPCWQIRIKKGRKVYSGGVWAPKKIVSELKAKLEQIRYGKKIS